MQDFLLQNQNILFHLILANKGKKQKVFLMIHYLSKEI